MTKHSPALQTVHMPETRTENTKYEQNVLHWLAKVCGARSKITKEKHHIMN